MLEKMPVEIQKMKKYCCKIRYNRNQTKLMKILRLFMMDINRVLKKITEIEEKIDKLAYKVENKE
ncbi:hypothetical protein [Caloranaerobacter azorensis]|uniref:hypothetical protein n=1 Tax=Caloranaerobacter azorensis TaxID=116090 RepID=UPI001FA85F0A|nr:hypothetical protein [Caloranaerobacter azorensis]